MARDLSKLPASKQASYEKFKSTLGEAEADKWYDQYAKDLGIDTAPTAPIPVAPRPVRPSPPPRAVPTPTQIRASLGVSEGVQIPSLLEQIPEEEYKALEAQTVRAKKAGVPTKQEASIQIATDLQSEGLQPFGETSAQFNKRLQEELDKTDYAEKRAMEKVASARQPLTVGFEQKPPIAPPATLAKQPEKVATMGGFEAIGQALLPQELETPAQTAARQTAKENEAQLEKSSQELSLSKGIAKDAARKEILKLIQDDFLTQATTEIGLTEPDKEEWKRLARKNYLQYLEQNLPNEYVSEIQKDENEAAFGIAGSASSPKAAFEQIYAPKAGEVAFGFLTSDRYDSEAYKKAKQKLGISPKTEAVVESLPMTIARDLAGLSRFAFNPLLDAVMVDVEPGSTKQLNPEEWGFIPRERTGPKEERAWGKTYVSTPSGDPVADKMREIAVEIATGRSLGDDLASQKYVDPEVENAYRGLGVLAEVALPINVFSVPGKVAGGVGRAAKATRFADVPLVGGAIKLAEIADDPLSATVGLLNAPRINSKIYAPLKAAAKKGGLSTADEIRKSTTFADALVDSNRVSVIESANAGDRYTVLGAIAKGPDDLLTNPNFGGAVKALEDIAPEIVRALKDPSVNAKVLAQKVLDEASSSSNAISRDAAKLASSSFQKGLPIPPRSVVNEIQMRNILDQPRKAIRTSLQESLSNTLLGEWSFITPNIVVSTKTAKSKFPGTSKTVVQELSDRTKTSIDNLVEIVPSGDSIIFRLKGNVNIKQLLKDSPVYSTPDRLKYYEDLFKGTGAGGSLTPQQYRSLHNLVSDSEVGKATRSAELGAFKVSTSGRAYKSASEPAELRSSLIGYSKQASEDAKVLVGKIVKKSFVDAPVKRYVSDIMSAYAGALESFPAQLSRTISSLGKKGFKEDQIFGEVLNRSIVEPQGAVTVTDAIKPMSNEDAQSSLMNIMRIQFGVTVDSPKGKAIDEMATEYGRRAFVDPADNAKTFLNKARILRDDIVQRFPELRDQEVVTQSFAAKTLQRDSLPDTILTYSSKITQDKILQDIISKNRNRIYDDGAVALLGSDLSKEKVIDGINAGLQARLNGIDSPYEILQKIKESAKLTDYELSEYGIQFVETVNNYYIDFLRGTHGFESVRGEDVIRQLNLRIQEIEPGVLSFLPDSLRGDIKIINQNLKTLGQDPLKASRVIDTVNEVERQAPGLYSRIFGDLGSLVGSLHKNIAEGMLAGKVIPNVTYLSENIFTAPLIAAVTNPQYIGAVLKNVPLMALRTTTGQTGLGYGRFGAYASDLYEPALRYPNKIAFVTPQGEQITNLRLWELFTQARIGAGQAETVLQPRSVAQLKQLAQILGAESELMAEASRRFKDFAPSAIASVPMTVAQNVDMGFRQALFKEALKRGKTPEEAATIARETLLDYSLLDRIAPGEISAIRKGFMFLSFYFSMSASILKATTRGETAENILRMARFHNDMAKYSGVYAPGQSELEALFVDQQQTIGDKPATYTYFRDPIFGTIFTMASQVENLTYFLREGVTFEDAFLSQFEELGYSPYIGFIKDLVGVYDKSFVPARQIVLAKNLGMWERAQSTFDIEEVPLEKMRSGEPTFDGKQYRFRTEGGKKKYISFMFALTIAGWNRTLNDYTNALVASGAAPEGSYLARYYPNNPQFEGVQAPEGLDFKQGLLYMIVRKRAVKPPTQLEAYDRQIQTELRKLKDLQLEQVED
jgi:hypothetical protein